MSIVLYSSFILYTQLAFKIGIGVDLNDYVYPMSRCLLRMKGVING